MSIPNDPIILLSYVNTKLRDYYPSLERFCEDSEIDQDTLTKKLAAIDYTYDSNRNQFI